MVDIVNGAARCQHCGKTFFSDGSSTQATRSAIMHEGRCVVRSDRERAAMMKDWEAISAGAHYAEKVRALVGGNVILSDETRMMINHVAARLGAELDALGPCPRS